MEQVTSLINRLEQRVKEGAASSELLDITGLLKRALEGVLSESKSIHRDSVAVWLPPGYKTMAVPKMHVAESPMASIAEEIIIPQPVKVELPSAEPLVVPKPPMVPVPPQVVVARESLWPPVGVEAEKEAAPMVNYNGVKEEIKGSVDTRKQEPPVSTKPFPQYPDVESLMKNIFPAAPDPKPAAREVNELVLDPVIALNEKLQEKKVELAEVLATAGPKIGDIRKAITINEKYQMINSLFRNDEDMFERSVRTLNNFGSLPEARFWMQRELVVKLGWNEEDDLVQHFYKLVSRRFS